MIFLPFIEANCSFAVTRVVSAGPDFFILVNVSLVTWALPLFDISLAAGKRTFIPDYRYNRY